MIYKLNIYRIDRRCKTGERKVGTYEFDRPDDEAMKREVNILRGRGYWDTHYRIHFYPKYRTVKSLMSGQDVVIDADTPYHCDPSYEAYWSS